MASGNFSLYGRITQEIGDEFTKIRVTSTQAPEPYFVVEHAPEIPGSILIGTPNQPIAFEVKSSGRRGFTTTLSYTGRTAAGQDEGLIKVASNNSFDPTSIGEEKTLQLDRWSDGYPLVLGSKEAAWRDTPSTASGNRSVLKLTVAPLLTVHAGGVEWNGAGPRDTSRADFKVLAERMARYQPGKVLTGLTDRDLQQLRARMQKLADTDSSLGRNPRSLKKAVNAEKQSAASLSAGKASLVRGEVLLSAMTPPIELQHVEIGGESVFDMTLFICPKDTFDAFKKSIPAPETM